MRSVICIVLLMLSVPALAGWSAGNNGEYGWYVKNGEHPKSGSFVKLFVKDKKTAKKLAKKLNKAEKKDSNGFWDDGSEHCRNPLNEC